LQSQDNREGLRALPLKAMECGLLAAGQWRSGENLSVKDIGNTFTVSQIFGGETGHCQVHG